MSQHDMVIENQGFAATRADINAALAALVTNSSGATEPATTYAYQWWADTTAGILKQRNAANNAWVDILNLSTGLQSPAASQAEMEAGTETALRSMSPLRVAQAIAALAGSVQRSYLAGLGMSTAGGSATMSIAAGQASDSANVVLMNLASSISKTTSAWTVGSAVGGLDTGTIANNTWYHWYVIRRPDTGVVDVIFSLSASAPTLPANYTQYRRIGSGKTNGSAQWTSFVQDGDYFRLNTSVLDVNATNPGTSAVAATLGSVPTGVNVQALLNVGCADNSSSISAYYSDLAASDEAPSQSVAPLATTINGTSLAGGGHANIQVRTNTSAQIRYRVSASGATTYVRIVTLGWIDSRGRNA